MAMTIGEVLKELQKAKPEVRVYFSFAHCVPTTVHSWRGIYSEPALGWADAGRGTALDEYPTVAGLIAELEKATDGREYTGWKGGDYSYKERHQLHIDRPGEYTCTELASVSVTDYQVVLHTQTED